MAINLVQGKQIATASWAINALTASYLEGYISPFPFTGSALITGSLGITGSLNVTQGITGSLFGTASFAISSSRAISASWAPMRPGGNSTQIQYNNNSVLAGDSTFTFNNQSQSLQQGLNIAASGFYSHAQGNQTTASGQASHAEGLGTLASGFYSHAEGNRTLSSGSWSHAEGNATTASGQYSHAEGWLSIASGTYSHAEGIGNFAIGEGSHAEGNGTQALERASHAEGLGTVASGSYQHVQGQYNISSSAQSAFIIGNGTANNARRNLVFASGSQFQITGSTLITGSLAITGSLVITGSLQGLGTVAFPNIPNTSHPDILYRDQITGQIGYAAIPTVTAATVDQINTPDNTTVFIRPDELEESKHTTINIYNNLNFI